MLLTDAWAWHDNLVRTLPEDIQGDFLPAPDVVTASTIVAGDPTGTCVVMGPNMRYETVGDGVPQAVVTVDRAISYQVAMSWATNQILRVFEIPPNTWSA